MTDLLPEIEISEAEAEAIARGLFAVAKADGDVHERERALISEFFASMSDGRRTGGARPRRGDRAESLASALVRGPVRQLFLMTALFLALCDGEYGKGESGLIKRYANAMEFDDGEVAEMTTRVKEHMLSQLSHLKNVDAAVAVARAQGLIEAATDCRLIVDGAAHHQPVGERLGARGREGRLSVIQRAADLVEPAEPVEAGQRVVAAHHHVAGHESERVQPGEIDQVLVLAHHEVAADGLDREPGEVGHRADVSITRSPPTEADRRSPGLRAGQAAQLERPGEWKAEACRVARGRCRPGTGAHRRR